MSRSLVRLWSFAIMVLGCAGSSAFAAPAYRIEDAMVYDLVGQRHIMFGGYDSHGGSIPQTRFNDIWEYDGATRTWYNVTPSGGPMPLPRSGHAFAFDPRRRVVVLFGGWNPTKGYLSDTWEWNCATRTWTQVSTSTVPSARHGARMMYDAAGHRLILFGGVDANRFYNETWRYSAGTWTRVTTTANSSSNRAFNGRTFHGLVYNSARGRLLIFGGIGYPNNTTQGVVNDFDDMWELVGTTWTDITPSGTKPGGRGWFGMTYETASNRVVVYGGWNNTSRFSYADTWAWNGSAWSQIAANSAPGPRDSFAMTYDTQRSRSVVFGGYWSDLWELSGSTWISVPTTDGVGPPPPTPRRVRGDFDGDRKADVTVFRPSTGGWFVRQSHSSYSYADYLDLAWGLPGDVPVPGDFDGDGRTDLAVYRPSNGTWYIRYSADNYSYATSKSFQWGLATDRPLSADFDGDGKADLVVYRPATGEWFVRQSSDNYSYASWTSYQWGLPGDMPMPADYDGDAKTDLAIWRPSDSSWYLRLSSAGYAEWTSHQWGLTGDVPIASDFDGDGQTDLTIFRPSKGTWYMLLSSSDYSYATWTAYQWGLPGDLPVPNDYDGDGKADLAVWRPTDGTWYVLFSSTGFSYATWRAYQWGLPGDIPLTK